MRAFIEKPKTTPPTAFTKSSPLSRPHVGPSHDPKSILSPLQTKLAINKPGDKYEQEANRVAEQVMHMPEMQRACMRVGAGDPEQKEVLPIVHDVLRSGGQAMDSATRGFMEPRFGHDFSRVRIHANSEAVKASAVLQARAYTFGSHIVFGAGEYAPATIEGKRLLAHELTHVVQQGASDKAERRLDHHAKSGATTFKPAVEPDARLNPSRGPTPTQHTAPYVQRQLVTPYAAGGGYAGQMNRDRARQAAPAPARPALPSPLQFYHGTRWSTAQNIGQIEARGIGDFARGFYTHFEPENNSAALDRAKRRGMWAARQDPPERYAGVLNFEVRTSAFEDLLTRRSRRFPLYDTRQSDYPARQREWLDYVTTHGRENAPTFFQDSHSVERWRHFELPRPAEPPQAITMGPFYVPRPGLPGPPPPRRDFQPYALDPAQPTRLQQQVVWAREGLDLLNSSTRRTLQFDASSGDPIDPPIPATVPPPPISTRQTPQNPEAEL